MAMQPENPYQSPEVDSHQESNTPPTDRITTQHPTWRFWVLVLFCVPAIAMLLVLTYVAMQDAQEPGEALPGMLLCGVIVIPFLASCALIAVYWRAPARQKTLPSASGNAGLVMAAIWVLALLAAPPAFFYTCTPAALLGVAGGGEGGALVLGLFAGVGGLTIVGWLARGLWLDAQGREIWRRQLHKDEVSLEKPNHSMTDQVDKDTPHTEQKID